MKKLISLFLVFMVSLQLNAQLRGGMGTYMLNQNAFNPGFQDINTRYGGSLNFRRQWMSYAASPITATANGYYRFTRNHGVGMVTSYDKIDEVGTFDLGASYTYQAWMTDRVAIGLGIKLGFSQRSIGSDFVYFDAGDPTFNQMSTAGFNMGLDCPFKVKTLILEFPYPIYSTTNWERKIRYTQQQITIYMHISVINYALAVIGLYSIRLF